MYNNSSHDYVPANSNATRTGIRKQQSDRYTSDELGSRSGLTSIITNLSNSPSPVNSSQRTVRSPPPPPAGYLTLADLAAIAAKRRVTSRASSTSSVSTTASHLSGSRIRSSNTSGHHHFAAGDAGLSSIGGSAGTPGSSRFARPASSNVGSPTSSAHSAGSAGQLNSLLLTQLNILLSTLKGESDRTKWTAQLEKIRKLVSNSGMELFTTYFRKLLQSNASTVFTNATRAPAGSDGAGSYQLLAEEVQKLSRETQQAQKIAEALDTSEGDVFRDFDLQTFLDHFALDLVARVALLQALKTVTTASVRQKAISILTTTFPHFLQTLAQPLQSADADLDPSPSILASIIERVIHDPRGFSDEHRENLFYAVRIYYRTRGLRTPYAVESAMLLDDLLQSQQDSRLVKRLQHAGPQATASLEACKEVLATAEIRDVSYSQIANVLLYMIIVQDGDAYNPTAFVEAVRQHRAGARIDWSDVVGGLDKEGLRVSKKQFLALYNALLPLAREYANFDIQSLWGGQWTWPETQLSFVVAFLSTTPEELDVMQIPNLKQAFELTSFATASDSIRAFAEKAIKHPLVSLDATEALFTMIFRSQDTYNMAQQLGIPDTIINQNMTTFVCAASNVPKPWGPLQEQALKQLFFPFLSKQHPNYEFVMHALWEHDKQWVATRLIEYYNTDPLLISLVYDHAFAHGWLELLFTLPSNFAVDLATYAHGKGQCDLVEWAQNHISSMGPPQFAQAIAEFLKVKIDDEGTVQREKASPMTAPLHLKTVHTLLELISDSMYEDSKTSLFRFCLNVYPRLFNYGLDDRRDAIIEENCEHGHQLDDSATHEMEEQYKQMYGGQTTPDQLVAELKRLKVSTNKTEQELFAAMLYGLWEEYHCFGEYPNEALATTAVLFGGLVSHQVLSGISEQHGIFMILDAVSDFSIEDPMYRFGLQALLHVLPRLEEWPQLAERILRTPSLRGTNAIAAAENVLKKIQQETTGVHDPEGGITNGVLDDDDFEVVAPAFTAIQVDPPSSEVVYEEPDEDISDKVMFVLNNVSKRNLDEKFKEIESTLEEKYLQWFAHYLVDELAKSQPNFQNLYLQILENFNKKLLWAEVLRETYLSCQKMLNAQSTMDNQHERATMKNLASWLGSITLARSQPILHRNLSFKDLLLEAYDNERLLVAIPFTCKTLTQASQSKSKVFMPPNPWIVELLGLLSELYHETSLKLNMKFEIEMLCRDLGTDIKAIEPLDIIRSRPSLEQTMLTNYIPEGGPDAFGEMTLMGLSKRGPNERFSPEVVISQVPDLGHMLQIPQAVGATTPAQMKAIFVNAAQQAIYEIIAPVVERSVTIASISTAELIQKDFTTEADGDKVRSAAHTMVKSLSGSLALVTCKEPLRMSITNNIRVLAGRTLPEQLPEGQILMFVNDNIDTVCRLVEQAAEDHSLAEIDLQLQDALNDRQNHNDQRPNEPFSQTPVNRWSTLIPEPYRQDQNGLNRQQLALYEDFGRQARIPPATHGGSASQDGSRALGDVLGEGYLPNMPTPAEAPAMPHSGQVQRMPGMQGVLPRSNGYLDPASLNDRIIALISELQHASREAPEEHINEIGEGATIRRVYTQILALIESSPQPDSTVQGCATHCLQLIYNDAQKRLEIEVLARFLTQLCRMSPQACRQVTMTIATVEDDRIFNAPATIALQGESLLDIGHIDSLISKALKQKRPIALGFFSDIVDELLLGDNSVAHRAEFVQSYEALAQWLNSIPGQRSEDSPQSTPPELLVGKEIMNKLQRPTAHVNGLPSPESETKNIDQQEYLFEEWTKLQNGSPDNYRYLAFVSQLHDKGVLANPEDTLTFYRSCLEYSCDHFEAISSRPYGTSDIAYIAIDALAKVTATLVLFQASPETEKTVNKAKSFEAFVRVVIMAMNDSHNRNLERFNGRVYFRLFSSLLCEIDANRAQLSPEQESEVYKVFGMALQVLQPRYFPGFLHSWIALISHRLLIPAFLVNGRNNGGWNQFTKLLAILFTNVELLFASSDAATVAPEFYRAVIKFMMILHHDFPDYLVENHMQLNAIIPAHCGQLQNIVTSAAPQSQSSQPNPFAPGLKINRLEQVRVAPAIFSDVDNVLEEAQVKAIMDRICQANDLSEQNFAFIQASVDRADDQISPILINALMVYVGISATTASSVFSAGTAPARLLIRLLQESGTRARYHLVLAMTNQLRFVNSHTHYFTTALQHIFSASQQDLQELILRVISERMMHDRPHPWGLLVLLLEIIKNPNQNLLEQPWVRAAPQVEQLLANLTHSNQHFTNSPLSTRLPLGARN
ncbi:Putative CCR4-Not complex component, Not1, CCR4-NOT transcription complex subunit 1, domain 4 [Septoria linicola]|uniref:General negative regulator of transcription subunit 1 n=1 Tax=Septoria linicola TaxID=215465 RepID=A0A9Q9B2Z0_9PEZI|nr:putative CCR4-Not complex component, Not1, CCR4-NOT transcription complex subunit 1, domain 4 [Septoria linicola]USW55391.1 Putative CCR4-Not complex component, Not1, CCR4-NOT transcription complex subunit 1, domain 4 [Septoria linicola]